jgi:hypothetical protein
MLERYSFIPVFTCLLSGLAWWSNQVKTTDLALASPSLIQKEGSVVSRRQAILEALDQIVAHEAYYHALYGRYTKTLSRTGVTIPKTIAFQYDIRVLEASPERLLVSAAEISTGNSSDVITINQDYVVDSNFPLPSVKNRTLSSAAQYQIPPTQKEEELQIEALQYDENDSKR